MESVWKAAIRFEANFKGSAAISAAKGQVDQGDIMAAKNHLSNDRSVREEIAHGRLMTELGELAIFETQMAALQRLVPKDWHTVEQDVPVRPHKTKITVDLDADVVKWFRAMGLGYQRRMNRILRTYMLAVISRHIERPEVRDWKGELLPRR
jgi:uncharacterized protein (DUF4415 family)